MASQGKGLICMPMSEAYGRRLQLAQMVAENTDNHSTAFTVSIDHIDTTTGISAAERSLTARKCADEDARPGDFRRPAWTAKYMNTAPGSFSRDLTWQTAASALRIS